MLVSLIRLVTTRYLQVMYANVTPFHLVSGGSVRPTGMPNTGVGIGIDVRRVSFGQPFNFIGGRARGPIAAVADGCGAALDLFRHCSTTSEDDGIVAAELPRHRACSG